MKLYALAYLILNGLWTSFLAYDYSVRHSSVTVVCFVVCLMMELYIAYLSGRHWREWDWDWF